MKILKTVVHIVEWVVSITILLLCLLIAAPILPSKYKIQSFVVITGSMKPIIHIGSVALVQKIPTSDLKKGDIIAFDNPKNKYQVIIHRIVDVKPTIVSKISLPFFITKGDANSSKDDWEVVPGAVKGKYIVSVPYLGYVLSEVKKPLGFLFIIGIPSLILIFIFAFQLVVAILEEMRKKRSKENKPPKISHTVVAALMFFFLSLSIFSYKTINALWLKNINASGISISAKDFVPPPVPTLLTPTDNSYKNTSGLVMDWSTELDYMNMHNPVYYIYQSALNSSFSPAAYTSGHLSASQIPASGTPNGEYWWHVKACDTLDNCSDWSPTWKVTVDSTAPTLPGQIGWTTENPPNGSDYLGGSDLANYKTCGGAVNYSPMTNLWAPSTDTNNITYEREVYSPVDNQIYSHLGMTTNYENGGGAVDGTTYWVRIRAKDIAGNYSAWTSKCSITYDTTAPSTPSMSITGSFTKAVEEKITNGVFESGDTVGWTKAGDVTVLASDTITNPGTTITPSQGTYMARIGQPDDTGNYVWENRLMQSFDAGAKSMSLHYNFFSREIAGFDEPGFFIRLNGQEIFRQNNLNSDGTIALNTGWSDFTYDLSNHTDSKVNLALYAGNTGDTLSQSWVYLDEITTYFVSAPAHATYTLSGSDNLGGSGIDHYEYNIDFGGWTTGTTFGGVPPLSTGGTHTLQYRSYDVAGNSSLIYTVKVITDDIAPNAVTDLAVSSVTENTANLTWTAPGNDGSSGRAALYDVRYSTSNITNDAEFEGATRVDKVPSPKEAGTPETLEILGLNPNTTYYFAIKTSDEAPNTSLLSNVVSDTTDTSLVSVNTGDIIINELMWMGSSVSASDEWIELRNMTDHSIGLSNFKLTRVDGVETDMILPADLTGKSIPAHGYFLIANDNAYLGGDSQLNVTPNLWKSSLDLSNTTLQIKLYWNDGLTDNLIDAAWNGTAPTEGVYDTTLGTEKYHSMERTSVPGDGTNPFSWYTCIDEESTSLYFDGGADERGTPGAVNRSENEPLAHQSSSVRPTPTISATPEATLIMVDDKKTVSFLVHNISGYTKLSYELSYDAFSSAKGMVGSDIDISSLDVYEKTGLDLATCSGEDCMYDTDIKNVKLIIILTDNDGKETTLEENL